MMMMHEFDMQVDWQSMHMEEFRCPLVVLMQQLWRMSCTARLLCESWGATYTLLFTPSLMVMVYWYENLCIDLHIRQDHI